MPTVPGVQDDEVAARLRSVLAFPAGAEPARGRPREPGVTSRYASGLGGLAAGRDPLRWSDVIPAWPDDVDLDPLPPPEIAAGGAQVVSDGVVALPPADTDGCRPGTPWASPSDPTHLPDSTHPDSTHLPDPLSSHLGDLMDDAEPRPSAEPLSAAGAFSGGRRFGLGAFDPGSRGVRALAAVAVAVIAIAAVLAWRARPQVDTVAPPSFDATTATAEPIRKLTASSAASELIVAVGGKVRRPGLVRLAPGARVADALNAAGGPAPGVDVAPLNLARKVVDGELIMVGVTPPPGVAATGPAAAGGASGGLVDLNTATLADLDGLPGVGPVLAQRILDARTAQGGFTAVSDLRKVDGIGDARYEQLKELVTV